MVLIVVEFSNKIRLNSQTYYGVSYTKHHHEKISLQNLADVVACNRDPSTGMVAALDGWNTAGYSNVVDSVQDVMLFSGSYNLGRITCRYALILYTILSLLPLL